MENAPDFFQYEMIYADMQFRFSETNSRNRYICAAAEAVYGHVVMSMEMHISQTFARWRNVACGQRNQLLIVRMSGRSLLRNATQARYMLW